MNTVQKEPLLTAGTTVGILGAFLIVLKAFHVPISADQVDALKNFFIVASPILLALIARQWVWSQPNHDAAVSDAIETTGVVKPSVTTFTATMTPAIAAPKPETPAPVMPIETPKPEPVSVAAKADTPAVTTDVATP